MAIIVTASKPESFWNKFEKTVFPTWEKNAKGEYTYSPSSGQYYEDAWFKVFHKEEVIVFSLKRHKSGNYNQGIYAIYHGRFTEVLLSKLSSYIESILITPIPDDVYDDPFDE